MLRVLLVLLLLSQTSFADVSVVAGVGSSEDAEARRVARAFFDAAASGDWSSVDPWLPFRYCTVREYSDAPNTKRCSRLQSRAAIARLSWAPVRTFSLDRQKGADHQLRSGERFVMGRIDQNESDEPEVAVTLILRKSGQTFRVSGLVDYVFTCDTDPC